MVMSVNKRCMGVLIISALCLTTRGGKPYPPVPAALPKLALGPDNVIGLFGVRVSGGGQNDSRALLDEQTVAGDPASGKGGTVKVDWMMGYVKWYYGGQNGGVAAAIDLEVDTLVSDIYAEHEEGTVTGKWSLFAKTPFDAEPVWTATIGTNNPPPVCDGWGWNMKWCGWNISNTGIKGRYLVLELDDASAIGEVVVYGKHLSPPPPPPPPSPPRTVSMGQFIGINSFVVEPLERQNVAGSIREYHDFSWDEGTGDPCYPHEQAKFSPDYSGFDSDAFYNRTFEAGIRTHAVLQGRPICQFANNQSTSKFKVVDSNAMIGTAATEDPKSYSQIAAHLFQYAARYGKTKVDSAKLKMAAGQPALTGAGWMDALEVRNEPNADWAGRETFMSPVEEAALLSACYDGHEGKISSDGLLGIKTADPKMKVSMGGLSGATHVALDIVKTMQLWFKSFRSDGKFPADILNFHFYCNDDQTSSGASPEDCLLEEVARNLTRWRDENEPEMEVWLTEFGYDTSPHSPNLAPAYGPFDAEQVQGMWLVRSYMYLAVAGIDRAHMFMLADVQDNGYTKFETSGLTSSKTSGFQPKKSWYHVATMSYLLNATVCTGYTSQSTDDLKVVKFTHDPSKNDESAPSSVYAAWLGSKSGKSMGLVLNVGSASSAVLVRLAENSTVGNQSALKVEGGTVSIIVSEVPVFIALGISPIPPTGPVPPITPAPAPQCQGLPFGLSCAANGTGGVYSPNYVLCPSGKMLSCPNGERCMSNSTGTIYCIPDPSSPCTGKLPGLYCTPNATKPSPAWPDSYIVCPSMQPEYCPVETPHCTQTSTNVVCK